MASKIGDTWFEYVCPVDGIDTDIEPTPAYGSPITNCYCGQQHVATEKIGNAFRLVANDSGESHNGQKIEVYTDEWKAQR